MSTFKTLDPIEHIRQRPGMYFGGTDSRSLNHLVDELLSNVIHQIHKGTCHTFAITILDDQTLQIRDEGEGIPVQLHQKTGRRILEIIMSQSGGGYDAQTDTFYRALHRCGLMAVSALSEDFHLEVKRDGSLWDQRYSRGQKQTDLVAVRPLEAGEATGTSITLKLDPEIFNDSAFDGAWIEQRLFHLGHLLNDSTIQFDDQRENGAHRKFFTPNGLVEALRTANAEAHGLHEPVMIKETVVIEPDQRASYKIDLEVAFQFVEEEAASVLSFANAEHTSGGTHVEGFLEALLTILLRKHSNTFQRGDWPDLLKHLTAIVSIWHPTPRFKSQTDPSLLNIDAHKTIYRAVYDQLDIFFDKNPALLHAIIQQAAVSRSERLKRRYRSDI